MNNKEIVVMLLVIVALGLIYFYSIQPAPTIPVEPAPIIPVEPLSNESLMKETFLQNLQESDSVYILMDTRDAPSQGIKEGILQCGVDLAGSQGLASKNITALALEGENCSGMNASINECLSILESAPSFHVLSGQKTEYFENKLVVSIDETYLTGDCSVSITIN